MLAFGLPGRGTTHSVCAIGQDGGMAYDLDAGAIARVGEYFNEVGGTPRDKRQRASFATSAFGVLGEGERKSAEPIAAP